MMFTVHAFDCCHNIQANILQSIHKYHEPGFHSGRAFADMFENLNVEEESNKSLSNKDIKSLLINEKDYYLQGKVEEKDPFKEPFLDKNINPNNA